MDLIGLGRMTANCLESEIFRRGLKAAWTGQINCGCILAFFKCVQIFADFQLTLAIALMWILLLGYLINYTYQIDNENISVLQLTVFSPLRATIDWIGCRLEYTWSPWIGLDWIGVDLAKWTNVPLWYDGSRGSLMGQLSNESRESWSLQMTMTIVSSDVYATSDKVQRQIEV